jgi:beta-glucosidase
MEFSLPSSNRLGVTLSGTNRWQRGWAGVLVWLAVWSAGLGGLGSGVQASQGPSAPTNLNPEWQSAAQKAEALLSRMTLEEKIGQLVLFTSGAVVTGPSQQRSDLDEQVAKGRCGSVFNAVGAEQTRHLQQLALEKTRLKIPLLFGYDVIHGYKTVFPVPLAQAASWDLTGIERAERVAATEAAAAGIHWTFAPMVDIARDPRWGRMVEGAGEDPYLGSAIARARVHGFQGKSLADASSVLACVKHFAAYGAAEAGRDYNTVDMSERKLREVYLPPYRAAIDAGALSVMTAFNDLNGAPCTGNSFLLQQVLRDEWGFKGFVTTDYGSISEMVKHGTAASEREAGRQALAAGVDLDMQAGVYWDCLADMVAKGEVTKGQIDAAAKRVLTLKFMLGLFDDPYRGCDEQKEKQRLYAPEHLQAAYDMACESLVLLKNEPAVLPLKAGANIAVIGALADSQRDLLGSWAGQGDSDRAQTILASIQQNNPGGRVAFAVGCKPDSTDRAGFAEALAAAKQSDLVVMVLGEPCNMSGECASRTSLALPGVQSELLKQIKGIGKPVVLVLMNGRPLVLAEESALADGLLEAWYPGTQGGKAVADVLFGKHNPAGKLPVTFPRNLGQVPLYYSARNTGRPFDPSQPKEPYKSTYLDAPNAPLYPFGFGLSYTTFTYSDVHLGKQLLCGGKDKLTVSVDVANTGRVSGGEVVQLYVRDLVGSVTRPVLELKGFQKISLAPGQTRRVTFELTEKDLTFLRQDMTWGTEPGHYQVFIGPNSRELKSAAFKLGS